MRRSPGDTSMSKNGTIHIQGQFSLESRGDVSLRTAASIRYEEHDPTSLDVEILYLGDEEERAKAYLSATAMESSVIKLRALNPGEDSITLLGLTAWQSTLTSMKLEVGAIEIGIDREPANHPLEVSFTVKLQPSGILTSVSSVELHHDGDISSRRFEEGSILVDTSLCQIEAMEAYDYLNGAAFGDNIVHRIQRARLCGKVILEAGETLRSIHDRLENEVYAICAALSLCYRQPVDAYAIEYFLCGSESESMEHSVYRCKWHKTRSRRKADELIDSSSLRNGGLSMLVQALRSHPKSESLDRGISFLAHSYVSSLETAYFMAFSAMETIVNAVVADAQAVSIRSASWKRVQNSLRASLANLAEQGLIAPETAAHMQDKLPELRRVSLGSRIDMAAEAYSVKTSDLWTAEGFSQGMKRASEFRNGLFHAAHTSDIDLMSVDLTRIRTFTERLLLSALSWPEERRWAWRDAGLQRIIQPPDLGAATSD